MVKRFEIGRWWLLGCLVLGTALRFIGIASSSVWYDEGFTMMLSIRSPARIWVDNIRDVHPPLHYLTLHYWIKLFGESETAIRALSAVFMVATIAVVFYLIRRLFDERAARWAALFVAIGPYMIRFSQEARMYGMVTFFLTLATFLLVRAIQDGRKTDWILYSVVMALAFYTHYYTIFMVIVHWLYLLVTYPIPKKSRLNPLKWIFVSKAWFASMVGTVILFAPWLPNAVAQFTKVSAGFWIPTPPPDTVPKTLVQFLTFSNLDRPNPSTIQLGPMSFDPIAAAWRLAALAILLGLVWILIKKQRNHAAALKLLVLWAVLPPILVFLISLRRSIYLDRYFTFSAVGFYALLAVVIMAAWSKRKLPKAASALLGVAVVGTMLWGGWNVHRNTNHRMREAIQEIRDNGSPQDTVISAEMYTYFDSSYYLRQYGFQEEKLLHSDNIDGYGVSSLIYTRTAELVVDKFEQLPKPASGYVWVIVQETRQDFFASTPDNWLPVSPRYHHGRIMVQRFQVI